MTAAPTDNVTVGHSIAIEPLDDSSPTLDHAVRVSMLQSPIYCAIESSDETSLYSAYGRVIDIPGLIECLNIAKLWLQERLGARHPKFSTLCAQSCDDESRLHTVLELIVEIDEVDDDELFAISEDATDWIAALDKAAFRIGLLISFRRRSGE